MVFYMVHHLGMIMSFSFPIPSDNVVSDIDQVRATIGLGL